MYELWPKLSQKSQAYNHRKSPTQSLPKLTIRADISSHEKSRNNIKKMPITKSHKLLEISQRNKIYENHSYQQYEDEEEECKKSKDKDKDNQKHQDIGQEKEEDKTKRKGESERKTLLRIRKMERGAGGANERYSKGVNQQQSEHQKSRRRLREYDLQFCKQKLKQFKQQIIIVRDYLMVDQSPALRHRLKSQPSQQKYCVTPQPQQLPRRKVNLPQIKSTNMQLKIGNFLKKRNKNIEKSGLAKVYPRCNTNLAVYEREDRPKGRAESRVEGKVESRGEGEGRGENLGEGDFTPWEYSYPEYGHD